jgi:hypothetical protein
LVVNDTAVLNARSGATAGKPLRVERQHGLEPLHGVEHQHRDDAEEEQRHRVLRPAHLVRLVDAGQLVDQAFDGAHQRIEAGASGA